MPNVTPRILGILQSGSRVPLVLICGCNLACAGSGVKRVTVDFAAEMINSLLVRKLDKFFMYMLSTVSNSEILGPVA